MIESVAFRTKARTVDHLGREQIADCPTAISELWKNSFDAYANFVELNIFDGDEPVATILDNGHGMSYQEFVDRWLVVGTESKFSDGETPDADMNGLKTRPKQGQKGIGRLSSANLGPLLLLVSKRKDEKFVAALLDWRIFENPYLILSDIKIPVTEFDDKNELFSQLPELFEVLMQNIWGGNDSKDRKQRIELAWSTYDKTIEEQYEKGSKELSPSQKISSTIVDASFEKRHIERWSVWNGDGDCGTALLVSNINGDLRAHLDDDSVDPASVHSKSRFFETLASFVDPYLDLSSTATANIDPQFRYEVWSHIGDGSRFIVGSGKEFDRKSTDDLEHVIDGYIDADGVFHGKIKAFGAWVEHDDNYVIPPPQDLKIHHRIDRRLGPVQLYIATYEQMRGSSTLSDEQFNKFSELADRYAGFLVFRDGLRILPYGRVDNDFFEIETRRSLSAGREFWNARRMFGRIALTREGNPNLRDKAGREGFIDNSATKTLKFIVENILMQSARDYFGSDADLRKVKLPEVQAENQAAKAREERNKLRRKQRKQFRSKLKKVNKSLPEYVDKLSIYEDGLNIGTQEELLGAQATLDDFRSELSDYKLTGAPQELGTLEEEYLLYRKSIAFSGRKIEQLTEKIEEAIQRIAPPKPSELLEKQLQRNAGQIRGRVRKWKDRIKSLQESEAERIANLIDYRNKLFHSKVLPLVEQVEAGEVSLVDATTLMEKWRSSLDAENEEIFEAYIRALESLSENIDLEMLAINGTEENDLLRTELERLNALAQLGVSVEILGHELQSYDDIIGHGVSQLPESVRKSTAVKEIQLGYDGLTSQLRFLSPLKLSGQGDQTWVTGEKIFNYVNEFFSSKLESAGIVFSASEGFLNFRVFDTSSRLLPVFINLVNNSRYWVSTVEGKKKEILLDVVDGQVVISDNGPGVNEIDEKKLFSLFFTKKTRGGRGVGLYLAKANLAAGGHKIYYVSDGSTMPLDGANFLIDFKGAEYDG